MEGTKVLDIGSNPPFSKSLAADAKKKSLRYTRAEVDLDAIEYNYRQMRSFIPATTKYMSVVKANAYGHGAVQVSQRLITAGTEYLAVAVLDEAMELRNAGIEAPILMFTPI